MNVRTAVATVIGCGAIALAGCGGSSGSGETTQATTTAGTTTAATATGAPDAGKAVFASSCGGCHTLKDAGTSGSVGPNLDSLKPDTATVRRQVQSGGGRMPAFGDNGILTPQQMDDVAAYVSSVAGK